MTLPRTVLPRTVGEVLADHVRFEVECIDRMYLNVYVPQLQYATGLVRYIHRQLGKPVASTAALAPVSEGFTRAVRAFAASRQIPWVDFARGQRKDDVAHEYLSRFTGTEAVLFIGRAQEKVPLFRTRKRRRADGSSYPWIAAETGVVNQYYCYCVDEDFGPFFLKFCSYFPFNAKLCVNGNEWAKRQAARAGIGFESLDNGFAAVDDVPALQAICHSLGPAQIDALLRKWLARLPHPFTAADRAAGYRYDISILQAEFSLTQMLDKPVAGRVFFEQAIRDNLDLGRPDRISLIFGRSIYRGRKNRTPGTFATRVVTDGVTPSLHVLYKHAQIKQYHIISSPPVYVARDQGLCVVDMSPRTVPSWHASSKSGTDKGNSAGDGGDTTPDNVSTPHRRNLFCYRGDTLERALDKPQTRARPAHRDHHQPDHGFRPGQAAD
jgi:hypothetical protein